MGDAAVTLFVHAGIAASDVICCAKLGRHHKGENHGEAVALLAQVDRNASRDLQVLLSLKTKAGYSHMPATSGDRKRAHRAAERLVEAARATQ